MLEKLISVTPEVTAIVLVLFGPWIYVYADIVIDGRIAGRGVVREIGGIVKGYCKYYTDMYLFVSGGILTFFAILKNTSLVPSQWTNIFLFALGGYVLIGILLVGLLYNPSQKGPFVVVVSDYELSYWFVPPRSRKRVFCLRVGLASINLTLIVVSLLSRSSTVAIR